VSATKVIKKLMGRQVRFVCPDCGAEHTASELNKMAESVWSSFRPLPIGMNCFFCCPSCSAKHRGYQFIPVVYVDGVEVERGILSIRHYGKNEEE
jgi:rubredoxin